MGAAVFDAWPKAGKANPVTSKPGQFKGRPRQFSGPFSHSGLVLDPLCEPDTKKQSMQWKDPGSPLPPTPPKGWEGDGISFLGYKGHCVHRLSSKR